MTEIGIGVVAGLITSLIVILFQRLWVEVVQPWYEERVYRDTKIEGRWIIEYPDRQAVEVAELKRRGHRVSGVITVSDGADLGKSFLFNGTFKNLILTGSYSAVNQRSLDRGSFAVMLKNNGQTLEGHAIYYVDEDSDMSSARCTWKRSEA